MVYLYINVVPFPGFRVRRQQSALWPPGAKSHFSWSPVSGALSKVSRRLQRRVLGSLLKGSGSLFSGLRPGVCEVCEKMLFWSGSWSEEQRSPIAKTCKSYNTSFKNRRCALTAFCSPTCVSRPSILDLKSAFLSLQLVADFLVLWRLV